MKTLILYTTKHGATGEIAQRIAKQMDETTVCDLKSGKIPQIDGFDCIVIGSALYAGMICKEAKEYISQNADTLRTKKLGLFVSGMDDSREKEFLEGNFPTDMLQAASATGFLGGVFDPKKVGVMGKLIMKIVAKQSGYTSNILDDKIKQFVQKLKSLKDV